MNGFFALHRLLMEIASRISKYIQSWTTDQVPDETVLKHNFKDGQGAVNAVPYDDMSASTALADANAKDGLVNDSDETSSDCTLYRFTVQQVLVDGTDDISSGNSVAAASCTPTPIVIEIDNEVQAMIDHIVPVRTQALPGQDYLFKVYYREGYTYVDGDITTNYGTLSKDGSILTVNSMYDLTVRLIMSPDPQGWDKEKPSEKTKQEETDVLLDVVPHDGAGTTYRISEMSLSDYFYYYYKYTTASVMITNVSNGSYSTVTNGTSTISLTYGDGYDHGDVECYIYSPVSDMPTSGWTEVDESVFIHEDCTVNAAWSRSGDDDSIVDTSLVITDIAQNFYVRFKPSEKYTNPPDLSDMSSEADDELISGYTLDSASLEPYFNVVSVSNQITAYCSLTTSSPQTPRIGADTHFDFSYTTGYEMVDTTATCSDPNVVLERKSTLELADWTPHDGFEVPTDYTVVTGIYNGTYNTYIKTGYVPKAGDKVTCYANVTANTSYSYNCLFGTKNGNDGNKSFCMWTRWNNNYFYYDRCGVASSTLSTYGYLCKFVCTDSGVNWDMGYADYSISCTNTVVDSVYDFYLFNRNSGSGNSNSAYGTIYRFYVDDADGNRVCEMVPVTRKSDSAAGFYNVVNNTFYPAAGGAVSAVYSITMQSRMYVRNITSDCTVTIVKNDNARRKLDISEIDCDTLDNAQTMDSATLSDYFYYSRIKNNAAMIGSASGSSYDGYTYNTLTAPKQTTYYSFAYRNQHDDKMISASANTDAEVTIEPCMELTYPMIPDEYYTVPGIYSGDSNTYFKTGYYPSQGDTVECYYQCTRNWSYSCYLFGCRDGSDSVGSIWFSTMYDSTYNATYCRCCTRVQTASILNQVVKLTCTDNGCSLWNGFDTKSAACSGTIATSGHELYVFGLNANGSRYGSMPYTTIYRFTIKDADGNPVLDMIPAVRREDGAIGFYDNVGDRFIEKSGGAVSVTTTPTLYGRISVSGITEDTTITLTQTDEHLEKITLESADSLDTASDVDQVTVEDWFHAVNVVNNATSAVSFTGYSYGTMCTPRNGGSFTITPQFSSGYTAENFLVSRGTLTNAGWTVSNVTEPGTVTISLNDWHEPMCDGDELGIFTDPDMSGYAQYRILVGSDVTISSYAFITSEPSSMADREIWAFKTTDIDLCNFDPSSVPGDHIRTTLVSSDSNVIETVTTVNIYGTTMYRHLFTIQNPFRADSGYQYMLKARSVADSGKLIAVAKNTSTANLVNSNLEVTEDNGNYYFNWPTANTYIMAGAHEIYTEINGARV